MPNLFITGNSSGLGHGLSEAALEKGWRVYGCSRRGAPDLVGDVHDLRCDLSDFDAIPGRLQTLLGKSGGLDLVILNAGILGEMKDMSETTIDELRRIMDINVWANKVVMDWLLAWGRPVDQVVMISSGAAVSGNRGWNGYAISKAALNMLAQLYVHEFPDTHISALAPGIIDTAMQDYLCGEVDADRFPTAAVLREARSSGNMPDPRQAGEHLLAAMDRLKRHPSGSFLDIRRL